MGDVVTAFTVTISRRSRNRWEWNAVPEWSWASFPNPSRIADPMWGPPGARTRRRALRKALRYVAKQIDDYGWQSKLADTIPVNIRFEGDLSSGKDPQ